VRGDQVFGERFCATTDGITSTDEDFFLDIDDMADDAGANANANPPAAPYAICSYLFQFLLQFDLFICARCDLFVYSAVVKAIGIKEARPMLSRPCN
jgi:hypothetical protein